MEVFSLLLTLPVVPAQFPLDLKSLLSIQEELVLDHEEAGAGGTDVDPCG
jgi:hypothetical protein